VLAAVNSKVFPGYWSVCADGQGFGYGNTYPSLDGHQMTDALLWLGQVDVVKANWDYVLGSSARRFAAARHPAVHGREARRGWEALSTVDANGGLYTHWVPGNPLRALAGVTLIQNADVIFRHTQDRAWLVRNLPSIQRAAHQLASLVTPEGAVRGAGYYLERPTRIECDGVAQCHAVDALRRLAALERALGQAHEGRQTERLAHRIAQYFVRHSWVGDHFAEYEHPDRGLIASHGLTDVDWAAVATGVAKPRQIASLWPRLRDEPKFHYGGMPTGISTSPESYESWEFTHPDRHDLAAMGRVWYVEAWARWRIRDGRGLADGLRKVAAQGRRHGFSWRERYHPDGQGGATPAGPDTYCEYPANFIRIVQRFLFGVELRLDGRVVLAPTVPDEYWRHGFGQTLAWRDRRLEYRFDLAGVTGTFQGPQEQWLGVRLTEQHHGAGTGQLRALIDDQPVRARREGGLAWLRLPAGQGGRSIGSWCAAWSNGRSPIANSRWPMSRFAIDDWRLAMAIDDARGAAEGRGAMARYQRFEDLPVCRKPTACTTVFSTCSSNRGSAHARLPQPTRPRRTLGFEQHCGGFERLTTTNSRPFSPSRGVRPVKSAP